MKFSRLALLAVIVFVLGVFFRFGNLGNKLVPGILWRIAD
jgi:hypothetical protein